MVYIQADGESGRRYAGICGAARSTGMTIG